VTDSIRLKIRWADSIEPENIAWLWKPAIMLGELGYCYGHQNEGKSPLWTDLAARISAGLDWPDGTKNEFGPRSVLMMSREDKWETIVVPRIIAAGGNRAHIAEVQGSIITKDSKQAELAVALERDIEAIVTTLAEWPDDKPKPLLLIIDPITDYLGKLQLKSEEQIRPLLGSLAIISKTYQMTTIMLGHFNKRMEVSHASEKSIGCAAMTGVPRFGFYLGGDKDSSDKFAHQMVPNRRINDWPGMKFKTYVEPLKCGDKIIEDVVRIEWMGAATSTADEIVSPVSERDKSSIEHGALVLKKLLAIGEKPYGECVEALEEAGLSYEDESERKKKYFSIRVKAGVESIRRGSAYWWRLKGSGILVGMKMGHAEPVVHF